MPPNRDGQMKWWGQKIFRNTQEVTKGHSLSAPPAQADYAQWDVPPSLQDDVGFANKVTFGERGQKWQLEQHRICWYVSPRRNSPVHVVTGWLSMLTTYSPGTREGLTPSEDFIISPHPSATGLYVATCGSFHGWKFFPILGKYIVQMLEGDLAADLTARWAWDRDIPDPANSVVWPRHELGDLKGKGI